MSSGEPVDQPLPSDEDERRLFYLDLAGAIARAPPGAAALFLSSTEAPIPRLVVRGLARPPPPRVDETAPPATSDGRRSPPDPIWNLVPDRRSSAPPAALPLRSLPERVDLLGAGGRVDFQTFLASGRTDGRLWAFRRVRLRLATDPGSTCRSDPVLSAVVEEWSARVGRRCRALPAGRRGSADWRTGRSRALPTHRWVAVAPEAAALCTEPSLVGPLDGFPLGDGHAAVFGSTGAGKTWFLAERAAETIRAGRAVLLFDLHGDLAPATFGRLSAAERASVVGVDITRPGTAGVAALADADERSAGHLVAAVKRLSPDGSEVYWGFRMERVFDAFVRLVQESGGSVQDLYELLTDADRRDVARLATRRPELASFLEELAPIVKRNPEFLWPAAARLAKIAVLPALGRLLAPRDGGVPLEAVLRAGRSVVIRIPFSEVGPEAASLAASLLLTRVYLGVAGSTDPTERRRSLSVVLDEVQLVSPRLVAEILAEGRKFGLRLLIATQVPDRLAPELRSAAAGSLREVLAFRVPSMSAATVGEWLGLSPASSQRLLPGLPAGSALARRRLTGEVLRLAPRNPWEADPVGWAASVDGTGVEFGVEPIGRDDGRASDALDDRILLAILGAEEAGRPLLPTELGPTVRSDGAPATDLAVVEDRLAGQVRRGVVARSEAGLRLTPAGWRQLGYHASTGATRETPEHRLLLLRAFRLFARRGYRLEIVRQGRFDTTLPDGRLRQLSVGPAATPRELAVALEAARAGWAWRFFGGRDVHVEAEVSGALRAERIRHGVHKAQRRGAFPLFVVADARRASRVRRTLRELGLGPGDAQVWTLGDRSADDSAGAV